MKKILLLMLMLPMAVWAQDEEVRRTTDAVYPKQTMCVSNERGWTASLVVETESSHIQIFDENWKEIARHTEPNKELIPGSRTRSEYVLFEDSSQFGYIEIRGTKLANLVVIDLSKNEPVKRYALDLYKHKKGRIGIATVGSFQEQGTMNLLWVENEKSNTIHQTTITLDGEVKITTYEPSAQTNKREAFKLKLFDTGHLIPFLEDRKIPPSDPFNGFRSNRLLNTSDKLCLIVDHVHRVMARDHHAHITLVDKKNGMYDSFFLPYDGTSFILGDSLFLFNAEQDFKTYSFNLHIFSIDQLFKDRAQTKPIYSLEFDSKTNPEFPIPFQKLQEFKHRGGTYVLSDSITTNNTKDIIGSMIRINSRPFLTIYPEGGNLHVRLGLISFSEGAVILPLPAVVVYGFYQIIGKQTWVMDLSYNPTSSEFVSSDMTEIPIWEKHQAVLQSLDKNTKQIRKTTNTFLHNGQWHLVYFNIETQELVFRKL